jgi:quercetin dioxygenase-like cupin family protein
MIVKANEAQKREFMGVPFVILAVGDQSMVTKMNYRAGVKGAGEHSHYNEQSGYVMSGKYRLRMQHFDELDEKPIPRPTSEPSTGTKWDITILQAGDSYSIPGNVIHSFEVMEPGEVIDFFTPPRADFLKA